MPNKQRPSFDYRSCMACRICVYACPFGCLDDTKTGIDRYGKAYPELVVPERCTGCSLCAKSCPLDAIAMKDE
jgi:Pyruvate/2-oxoacid:ferredoxin oxidoreductase delta subunit